MMSRSLLVQMVCNSLLGKQDSMGLGLELGENMDSRDSEIRPM